jgi:plasmid stabilization system protein ParE
MPRYPKPTHVTPSHIVNWTPTALAELDELGAFLAVDPAYAADVAVEIQRAAESLNLFPSRGRLIEGEVRFIVVLDRHILRYEHHEALVDSLGVRDGRRDR